MSRPAAQPAHLTRALRRLDADEAGLTLVELLVAVLLASVVGIGVVRTAAGSVRAERAVVDVRDAMDDARTATERIRRDVRDARRVTATATRLELWVDDDQDGVEETPEQIVYQLVADTGSSPCGPSRSSGAARLTRTAGGVPSGSVVCNLRSGTAFTRIAGPPVHVRLTLTARGRADDGRNASDIVIDEVIRVRNA